jgi:WD40 repeat protein
VATLAGHTSWTSRLTFTADGTHLISSNADQTLRSWETKQWRESAVWRGHVDEIWTHALSPDGRVLLTGAKDGMVLLWPGPLTAQSRALFDLPADTIAECTTRDGRVVTLNRGDICTVFERGTWQATRLHHRPGSIWLWDAAGLFSQLDDETIGFFDPAGEIAEPRAKWKIGRVIDMHVRNGRVAFLTQQGRVIVTTMGQPGIDETLPPLAQPATSVELTVDGTELIVRQPNEDMHYWNFAARRFIRKVSPGTIPDTWVASPDISMLAWCKGVEAGLMPLFRPVNRRTWRFDGTASALAWAPDGKLLAIGSYDATALVWDVAGAREVTRLRGHLNAVHSAAFAPDGTRLVTFCSNAEGAKFWDTTTWQELITLSGPPIIRKARFSPNGDMIFIRSPQGRHAWWAPSFAEIEAADRLQR